MMMAQKFMAPKMARTLRDICSDREACLVQENIVSEARGTGERGHSGQRPCPHGHPGPGDMPVSLRVPGQHSLIVKDGKPKSGERKGLEHMPCTLQKVGRARYPQGEPLP